MSHQYTSQTVCRSRELAVAEAVRVACARTAREAYNDAAIQGLCSEGAAEVAVGAIQALDLAPLLADCGGTRA